MNKICKEYMGEIKTLFPIKKKAEKAYLRKLTADVEDYCEEANVTTKQELYDNYGMPYEVVSNYLSTIDTNYITKNLRIAKFIRRAVVIILLLATITTVAYGLYMHHVLEILEYNRLGIVECEVEDYGTSNDEIIDEEIVEEIIIEEEFIEEEIIEETTQ